MNDTFNERTFTGIIFVIGTLKYVLQPVVMVIVEISEHESQ